MATKKKRGAAKAVLFLVTFLFVAVLMSLVVNGACFQKGHSELVWGDWQCGFDCGSFCDEDDATRCEDIARGGGNFGWEYEIDNERGGPVCRRNEDKEDECRYRRRDNERQNQVCYTGSTAEDASHPRVENQVCLITAANPDGECVSERETGDFCCIVDERQVTITREEFDQAPDNIKQACLRPEQGAPDANFGMGPGILRANGRCDLEEITERVNLDEKIDRPEECPADQAVCGAQEKADDAQDKTGLDAVLCCTVNEPVDIVSENKQTEPIQFTEENREVQCPVAKPVLCGANKNAAGDYAQLQCCAIQEITIETREPRQVIIKDGEQQCDNNEFACGFIQAKALVGANAAGFGGNEQFINAPGGILCCKDRQAAERAEDRDDDKVLNADEGNGCDDTPAGERGNIITPADVQQHPELAPFLGCGPSEVDADEKPFICEEIKQGTWLTRKDENFQMVFDEERGACCGGGFRLESFSKEGLGVTQACLWNEPLARATRGGGDIIHPRKPLGDSMQQVGFIGGSFESPSLIETNEPSYTIENGAAVIPPGGIVWLRPVNQPNHNLYTLAFDYLISHPGDELQVQQRMGNQLLRTSVEFVTPAFQRKKIVLAPQETFRVSFFNQGEHPIRISREQIYAEKARKVLHVNGEFFGCAMDDDARRRITRTNPRTEQRVGELIPAANVVQPSCAADQKKEGFYCSFENVWKKGAERNEEKPIPSDELLRSVEINPATFPRFSPNDCCAATECWTGARCVSNNFDAHFASRNGQKALFCSNGAWKQGDTKTNQFVDGSRVCPEDMCAYKVTARGREEMTCKPNGFYGPANNEGSGEDVFCDAGEWTSRPVKLAAILSSRVQGVGDHFSLYCDTPDAMLVNKDYSPVLSNEASRFMQQGGVNYACILEFNTHAWKDAVFKGMLSEFPIRNQNVIVALALKNNDSIITAPSNDEALLPSLDPLFSQQQAFDGTTVYSYCYGAFKYQDDPTSRHLRGPDDFYGCTGVWEEPFMNFGGKMLLPSREAKLWYNRRINAVLYSPKQFRFLVR